MPYKHKVRDAIHGFIRFSDIEKQLIDRPEFQRLRSIRQLALTNYVYPGATHTRFEHSLGVMELSSRVFDTLVSKQKELIQSNFNDVSLTIEQVKSALRVAALLHDVGHLPFSHGGEAILGKNSHEDVSIAVIRSMEKDIDTALFSGATNIIVQFIEKKPILPQLNFIKNILSGSVDADRMDYLLRDSHHCGVEYGRFDYNRLIQTLTVTPGRMGGLDLAIEHGGVHSFEALILARYYMFTQVYFHRTRRIYDHYLKEYMIAWNPRFGNLINVIKYDDISLVNRLRAACSKPEEKGHELAKRICERVHHSVIYETRDFIDAREERKVKLIYKKLQEAFPDYNFVLDHGNGRIHKFFVPDDQLPGEEFMVIHDNREYLITEASHIIKKMPKEFNLMRIYVDQKDSTTLDTLHQKAIEFSGEVR